MRDPNNKWVLWVRWLALVGAFFVIVMAMGEFPRTSTPHWLGIALMFFLLWRYKLLKQCLELQLNGHTVAYTLHLDIRGGVWATSRCGQETKKAKIGKFYGAPVWLTHTVKAGLEEYNLLIWVKPYPQGFLVGHGSEPYHLAVKRNAMCF